MSEHVTECPKNQNYKTCLCGQKQEHEDPTMKEQLVENQRRNYNNSNSFYRIGASSIYVNSYGRKLERATVHGSITYREYKD